MRLLDHVGQPLVPLIRYMATTEVTYAHVGLDEHGRCRTTTCQSGKRDVADYDGESNFLSYASQGKVQAVNYLRR